MLMKELMDMIELQDSELTNLGQLHCDSNSCNFRVEFDFDRRELIIKWVNKHIREFEHYQYSFEVNIELNI